MIDAHHHLWDLDACHYPWLMEQGVIRFFGDPAPIQRNYLASELRDDAASYELAGSVHIQVGVADGDEVNESRWLDEAAEVDGLPSALVGFCDLAAENAQQVLDDQSRIRRLRGIRHIVGRSQEEDAANGSDGLLDNPVWVENLASLRERNLSFDLQLIPQQIERAAKVLQQLPGLQVALCHCGSPWDQSPAGLARWRAGLEQLAALPDVYCKISGLAMFNHRWSIDEIRTIVTTCIHVFGARRCMFGSNFPVDKLHKTYDEIWQAYETLAGVYSVKEQERLFSGTAAEFYSLN
ncbi:MAG: amidohydrolase family protein [Gammaproteobacteria bacterium]|nr:amidohydrolase family protein [Gammaproteobacteria bacterium]